MRNRLCFRTVLTVLLLTAAIAAFAAGGEHTPPGAAALSAEKLWERRIEPLLDRQCMKCHAGVRQRGGLDLRSLDTVLRGGDSGPAIAPGNPGASRLLQYVLPGAAPHMPPDPKRQLSPGDIAALKTWISSLPERKTAGASAPTKENAWVPAYLTAYRRSLQTRPAPPASLSASETIDWHLAADWKRDGVVPSDRCSDPVFARRLYLDLAGRIPTRDELHQFLALPAAERRRSLITKLLESDEYPRRMRELFDVVLMGRPGGNGARERADCGWFAYLEESFRGNRPWNEMVREMIVARPADGKLRGAVRFLSERNNNYQSMAEAVAPVAFGVKIQCAQCHNHPLAWEIEQRHYWGMVAVFNRSKNVDTDAGPAVAESAIGGFINFANLKKESQPASLIFLNGKSVPETIPPPDAKESDAPSLYLVPPAQDGSRPRMAAVPKFSRREAFADSVTRDNPQLARAFVNRMWGYLIGRGIVHPVDEIDSRHHASHPELLEWLTRDFQQSGYDVKRLVRTIVLSRAYQLDVKPAGKSAPLPETFARALEKPLSAEQLLHSLWIAVGSAPEAARAAEMERAFAATFPEVMPANYSPSLQQALLLTNAATLDELLKPAPGSMIAKIAALPSPEARVREAFSAAYGRAPDAEELARCVAMLKTQSAQRGARNLLWALVTSAEFQVNH